MGTSSEKDCEMKLSECKFGVLVQSIDTGEIGMVKGITNNLTNLLTEEQRDPSRAIPLVEWQSGRTTGIHHGNIKLYKD